MAQYERGTMGYSNIRRGAEVFASDNKKVGEVEDVAANYVHIGKGFLFKKDLYVPKDAVTTVQDGKVYINTPSDRIDGMHWYEAPTERYGTMEGEMRVPIREEELEVEKRMGDVGEVDITKRVTEERQTMRVPRVHEEVTVERQKVDRPSEEPIGGEETYRVPIREEEILVEKHARVKEELVIKKHPVVEEEEVTGTIRKEHVDVQRHGIEEAAHRHPERYERTTAPVPQPETAVGKETPKGVAYRDIRKGADVYCSDNRKIGDVSDVTANYIHVKKGFLFTTDLYIPLSAVERLDHDRVYLNVTCDRVKAMNWNEPPRGNIGL